MKKLICCALGALVLASGTVHASVDTIPFWHSDIWKVEAVPVRQKCMAQSFFAKTGGPSGATLAFEIFNFGGGAGEVLVSSLDWAGLFKKGKKYYVNAVVDSNSPQRMIAEAYSDGGLAFPNLTVDAVKAFAEGYELRLGYKNQLLAGFNLKGSYDAVVATLKCADALQKNSGAVADDGTGEIEEPQQPAATPPPTAPLQIEPAPAPKKPATHDANANGALEL